MTKVVPVAVKFLHRGNKELSKNLASYLSLTVIHNSDILIPYTQIIIDSVIGGNHCLIRVLPKIYTIMSDRKQFHDHVMALTCLLPHCEIPERLPLLNLFSLMSKTNPSLLEMNLPVFVRCLSHHQTVYPTLQILLDMAQSNPKLLSGYLDKITDICLGRPNVLPPCAQFFGIIGRNVKEKSSDCLNCLSRLIGSADQTNIIMLLREMNSIVRTSPHTLQNELKLIIDIINSKKNLATLPSVKTYLIQLSVIDERKPDENVVTQTEKIFIPPNQNPSNPSSVCSNYNFTRKVPPRIDFNNYAILDRFKPLPSPTSPTSIESRCGQSYFSDSGIAPSVNTTSSNGSYTKFNQCYNHIPKLDSAIYQPLSRHGVLSTSKESECIGSNNIGSNNFFAANRKYPCQACCKSKTITDKRVRIPKLQNLTFGRNSNSSTNFILQRLQAPSYVPDCYSAGCPYGQDPTPSNISQCPSNPYTNAASNCHIYSMKEVSDMSMRGSVSKSHAFNDSRVTTNYQTYNNNLEQGYSEVSSKNSVSSQYYARPDLYRRNLNSLDTQSSRYQTKTDTNPVEESLVNASVYNDSGYASQDVVQRFCDKHLSQIKVFVSKVKVNIPLPTRCSLEDRKSKKHLVLHFSCGARKSQHCLSSRNNCHNIRTKHTRTWIHLIFLAMQADSDTALSCSSPEVAELKSSWSAIASDSKSFQMVVTSSFPTTKEQETLKNELKHNRYFDMFEFDPSTYTWSCCVCHVDNRTEFSCLDSEYMFERAIKEKKPRWKIFRRLQERYMNSSSINMPALDGY